MHQSLIVYLFFVCLYVNCFLVLRQYTCQLSPLYTHVLNAMLDVDIRCELSQFASNHILCYSNVRVRLAIVDLKLVADEDRQNSRGACLRFDRGRFLAG